VPTQDSYNETRRHPRYQVEDVEGTFLFNIEVHVLNMSVAGMAVATSHSLQVGRSYSFKIEQSDQQVELFGTVAWCVLRGTRRASEEEEDVLPVYHAGVRFDDVLTERAQEIRSLIEQSAVIDVNPRIFGRFRIGRDASVTLDSQVPFEVRKISLSGMLVESLLIADLNTVFPLEMNLANGLFSCQGRVAFVEPPEGSDTEFRARLGIEFIDMTPESASRLENYIAFLVNAEP
jgi:hypothetical protein